MNWSHAGMAFGGVWGAAEGLKHTEGRTYRLRMNSILNGCTRRGPFLGNNLAVLGKKIKWHVSIGTGIELNLMAHMMYRTDTPPPPPPPYHIILVRPHLEYLEYNSDSKYWEDTFSKGIGKGTLAYSFLHLKNCRYELMCQWGTI